MSAPPDDNLLLNDRYRLLRKLQRNHGSSLFEAHDEETMKLVHLRLLDENLRGEPLVTMRFRREFAVAHRLDHPSLITAIDLIDAHHLALIYPHPGNFTLADLLHRQGPLSLTQSTELLLPILEGLEQAHRRGIIHRDIRPDNIWIDDDHKGRLAGFGAARVIDMVGLTTQSVAFAISPFTAPEQLLGHDADPRVDVFAIAKILLKTLGEIDDNSPIASILDAALTDDPAERIPSIKAFRDLLLSDDDFTLRPHHDDPPCWSCGEPRIVGLFRCIYCGEGSLIQPFELGKKHLIIPKNPTPESRGPLNIFFRSYQHRLTPNQQHLLYDRLRMAGFELYEKDSANLADLPLRIVSKLSDNNAARLAAFLQRQEVLSDTALLDLKERNEPSFQADGDFPLVYEHRKAPKFSSDDYQVWSLRGLSWGSPLFFYLLLIIGGLIVVIFGIPYAIALVTEGAGHVSEFFHLLLFLPFVLVLGGLHLKNRRPVVRIDSTGIRLLNGTQTREWATLINRLSAPDRALVHQLFRSALASVRAASTTQAQLAMAQLLTELRPDVQTLTDDPDREDWATLQHRIESLLAAEDGPSADAYSATAALMRKRELAKEQSDLARARIHQLIQRLDAETSHQTNRIRPENTPSSSPSLTETLDELRFLHQSFLEVEDIPRFDDIEPARQKNLTLSLSLPERFDLIRRLAAGGQAEIFLAYDHLREESVALKIPHPHRRNDPTSAEILRREFAVLQAVDHPNIVAAYELLELSTCPILVLEYCPGVDLKTMIRVGGPLPLHEIHAVADAALAGLNALHRQGLVHGDIKPANLIVDEKNRLKIIDFGLAQRAHLPVEHDQIMGTPAYAAPELLAGEPLDETTDLYGLALTLVEAHRGSLPVDTSTDDLPRGPLRQTIEACLAPRRHRHLLSASMMRSAMIHPSPASAQTSAEPTSFSHRCHRCDLPLLTGLGRCLECGAHARNLRPGNLLSGQHVILTSPGRRRFLRARTTLTTEESEAAVEVLQRFENLAPVRASDGALLKAPAILTPPLAPEDAALVRDELRAHGLNARTIHPGLTVFARLPRWMGAAARQTAPILGILPIAFLTFILLLERVIDAEYFNISSYFLHLEFYLLFAVPALIWQFLILITAATDFNSVTLLSPVSDDGQTHHRSPWTDRLLQLFDDARTERTKNLLRELATQGVRARNDPPLAKEVDRAVDAALDRVETIVATEETLLDFGDDPTLANARDEVARHTAEIVEITGRL